VIIELCQDGSVRVAQRKDAERRVKRNEVRAALEAAAAAFDDLVDLWEQYHG
jgi:hypothetical protein